MKNVKLRGGKREYEKRIEQRRGEDNRKEKREDRNESRSIRHSFNTPQHCLYYHVNYFMNY